MCCIQTSQNRWIQVRSHLANIAGQTDQVHSRQGMPCCFHNIWTTTSGGAQSLYPQEIG